MRPQAQKPFFHCVFPFTLTECSNIVLPQENTSTIFNGLQNVARTRQAWTSSGVVIVMLFHKRLILNYRNIICPILLFSVLYLLQPARICAASLTVSHWLIRIPNQAARMCPLHIIWGFFLVFKPLIVDILCIVFINLLPITLFCLFCSPLPGVSLEIIWLTHTRKHTHTPPTLPFRC